MNKSNELFNESKQLNSSPLERINFNNKQFFIKRDDLLHPYFSGNKARKFAYYLHHDFNPITKVIGYGSVQANSLYSLAALAKLKGWQLDFYCKPIPTWLKATPLGNYAGALSLGANIIEVNELSSNLETHVESINQHLAQSELLIPEGGRSHLASSGVKQLALEIIQDCQKQKIENPLIMLPAGTGTTALFLQRFLPYQVLTCACVGKNEYLEKQFQSLEPNSSRWPTILSTSKSYHFGKLYPEFFSIWQSLKAQTEIEFDLLYDPLGWLTLEEYLTKTPTLRPIIYIHQGGLKGNESMLPRYHRKYDT
ncbi:1-aminocyclopropane-1-carboxylate deaminase/D-cysteine desulfhydrase [Colwellia sp. RSH04]|uniref:1-aminocyclopropane-1-carboxylate deaminase/D-cysteine desulfhydrase n=1 Tax=Colwellia sp. RSH04 TaxID=2305464 RepID=UPI000E56B79E|nr:1-aminocyclopropane-1-carboxylate deaminase/D-cysteine desulfhydrase [Colwellia sp. RSH04]RHW77941.1 1-aminocyclopropane-1-carboxylate deaminase/D-cysteine desulfhydrase [Colwellia sp. RSH04]